ncbi:thioredoxin family protein [bacterium]|nr:thioredoxin family protein [bacterium]
MGVQKISTLNFKKFCSQDGIVLIDVWAPWCPPCRGFGPIFLEASDENLDCAFGKLNMDENGDIGKKLRIESIPTLLIFRDGILLYKDAGAPPKDALNELIQQVRDLEMDDVRARSKTIT